MKYTDLVVGQQYWCSDVHRIGWFKKIKKQTWCGKTSYMAVFYDICDCLIEFEIKRIEKYIIPYEEFQRLQHSKLIDKSI